MREMHDIDYRERFDKKWNEFTEAEQQAINAEISCILDSLIEAPSPKWGSIMNTSIEGGKVNPFTGIPGDWSDTPWQPIWEHHGYSDEQAALFFGILWKLRIIERPERWIGIRTTTDHPTFPNRGINLAGKTYFLAKCLRVRRCRVEGWLRRGLERTACHRTGPAATVDSVCPEDQPAKAASAGYAGCATVWICTSGREGAIS